MRYEPASWNTDVRRCQVGALALLEYFHEKGFGDVGCWNDRSIAGTNTPSLHREGRAIDGTPNDNVAGMTALLDDIIAHHLELEVQQVIWLRRIWTVNVGWRSYGGVDPHTGHCHVELTWWAAENLTIETIRDVLEEDELRDDQIPVLAKAIVNELMDYEVNDHSYDSNTDSKIPVKAWMSYFKQEVAQIRKKLVG